MQKTRQAQAAAAGRQAMAVGEPDAVGCIIEVVGKRWLRASNGCKQAVDVDKCSNGQATACAVRMDGSSGEVSSPPTLADPEPPEAPYRGTVLWAFSASTQKSGPLSCLETLARSQT